MTHMAPSPGTDIIYIDLEDAVLPNQNNFMRVEKRVENIASVTGAQFVP